MLPLRTEGAAGERDLASGVVLIVGALVGSSVMLLHPSSHDFLQAADPAGLARRNVAIHAFAIAGVGLVFLGLAGLTRRLGASALGRAALVAYGLGAVAVLIAAVASGFVATSVLQRLLADAESRPLFHALLAYTGFLNQGFAKVGVVASSTAILLWGAAILRHGRVGRAAGVAGCVVGGGVLVAFLAGHLGVGIHGFGAITFAQSAWLVWLGILLCRDNGGR